MTVIAFDDNKENKRLMKEGSIDVLLCQESFRQGYDAINHLFYYLVDGTVPKAEYFTHTVIKSGKKSSFQSSVFTAGPLLKSRAADFTMDH